MKTKENVVNITSVAIETSKYIFLIDLRGQQQVKYLLFCVSQHISFDTIISKLFKNRSRIASSYLQGTQT